ncbi:MULTISPECIES: heavy-metal-associated domain-containing protein [unclassified Arenibacter]|uniref:heavy-metal-associated domain-containing protein n=1 Tax=unclassified Arenibacter TaxID=2615047 RepID=UPI000E349A7D|nr:MULTISPECIES: heavy metal-associated domain-containing protein [unclassified Arenibacter]MCM4163598.1 heavy metal transporter [Arenibacter sp. A80]RFT56329.1 heavy-metal-associated domain-containing protein [Arenibacter sp. P308M17]|tara:strand:+ start:37870 stop:38583 length:714 start_codon:yes stop_codon:yes gene_type:complete
MVHTYQVTGMTCSSCEAKVKSSLLMVENVVSVEVSKQEHSATITMGKHIGLDKLQKALPEKYQISALHHNEMAEEKKGWLETYKPIILIFFYISLVTLLVQFANEKFDAMQWMRHFMAGFFLVFSFFKMLNLKGFAESYVMYDVIAKRLPIWAYVYVFTELVLGIAFLVNFNPLITNGVTFLVMAISIIGVLQSVLNKKKIQCACLGAVFNLPMSTVTIIEDALMIAMSAIMLFYHL